MCPSQSITSASVVIASSSYVVAMARAPRSGPSQKAGPADAGGRLVAEQLDDGRDDVEGRTNAVVADRGPRGGDVGHPVTTGVAAGPAQRDGADEPQPRMLQGRGDPTPDDEQVRLRGSQAQRILRRRAL